MKLFNLVSAVLAFRLTDAYLVAPPGTPAPGADSGCSEWVQQSYGLTCAIIEQFFGMTAAQFEAWNPSVTLLGPGCNLIKGLYYCVQVDYVSMSFLSTGPPTTATTTSTASSTTSGGNGITTPTPTQSGMVGNCNKFYMVVSGDECGNIATTYSISLANFYAWNPAVGSSCATLWPGYYVCVGIAGSGPSSISSVPSTTKASSTTRVSTTTTSGNGITTPTPTQSGMVGNCNKFYMVVSGDECGNIATTYSISLANFYAWNPAVGSSCATLWPDYYVCVGITGGSITTTVKSSTTTKATPSTTTKGNSVATPTPTQANMTTNCKTFYDVKSGDDCFDIAAAANITLSNFYAWNPAVGSSCSALWPNYYVCIGIV